MDNKINEDTNIKSKGSFDDYIKPIHHFEPKLQSMGTALPGMCSSTDYELPKAHTYQSKNSTRHKINQYSANTNEHVDNNSYRTPTEQYSNVVMIVHGKKHTLGRKRDVRDTQVITDWLTENAGEIIDILNGDK
jgi:hypothetical protein